jgi:HEAT repeat protein
MKNNEDIAKADVNQLVKNLASKDGMLRVKSRHALVSIGEQALQPLTDAMSSKDESVRWEATKALGQIAAKTISQESTQKVYQTAVTKLVESLDDKNFDVRWLAAEGLVAVGERAVHPILEALIRNSDSLSLREGAHHVFHDLVHRAHLESQLMPIINALEDLNSPVEVPFVARSLMDSFK